MSKKNQHVVPAGDGWEIKNAGNSRATGAFKTQKEAIQQARENARSDGSELIIHGRDGKIRERNSYGNDPHPPKG